MARVIEIPAIEREKKILRVAPYCRVSSNSADQLHSYAAQIDYYTKKVGAKPDWELVDIYADEGLTGTRMDKRDDLDRLISDCKKGKIDKVLIKSISRLARNTADSLTILRDLKLLGVSVQSEKENFDTAELTSEMLIMLWSNHAQSESTSISQNQRWSYQKRMRRGEFITCHAPYGYRLVGGKMLEIDESEAEIVRWIFRSFLDGMGTIPIALALEEANIPTPDSSPSWNHTAVQYILKNEKYIGDTLAQKTYTTDTFPFQSRINHGERDQYYIRNSHPAIITRDVFEKAQTLLAAKRTKSVERKRYPLTKMIVCGNCGSGFQRRVTANGYVCWVCWKHNQQHMECCMPRIAESSIYDAFIRMVNKLREHRGAVLEPALTQLEDLQKAARNGNAKLISVRAKLATLSEQSHMLNSLRADGLLDDETWQLKSNAVALKRAELQKEQYLLMRDDTLTEAIDGLRELINTVQSIQKPLAAFDADTFTEIVEKITVYSAEKIAFRLTGGIEIVETIRIEEQ